MDSFKSPKFYIALLLVLAVTAVVVVALATANRQPFQNQMSVTGEGKVFAKPDTALVRLGVRTEARPTAAQAVSENTKKMNEVVEKIKALGIEEKDIKTTVYTLSPEYNYVGGRQQLRGYSLMQEVQVKVRDMDTLNEVIGFSAKAGANQIGDIAFTINDPDVLKAQARQEAIAKAKEKAESIARLSGIELGDLINVYENEQPPYPGPVYGLGMGGEAAMAKSVAPQLEPGQNEITVDVTLVWEVED